jgi:GNAT superfamily N-acetyltransferase
MITPTWSVRRVHALDDAQIGELADVLIDCVEGGASVSFMHPLPRDRAVAFWRRVAQGVAAGERALLVAGDARGLCGTVQLVLDQPENQPHRADLSKVLVHRRARRQGLGAALMRAAEATARECGKTLLVLDTASGEAERLYERLGWVRVGVIPGYALLPQGFNDRRGLGAADWRSPGARFSLETPAPRLLPIANCLAGSILALRHRESVGRIGSGRCTWTSRTSTH